jgi:chemotaxis protein CheC
MVIGAEEQDAITELFNIGMGQAAASLSELAGEEVRLSIPLLEVRTRGQLSPMITALVGEPVCTIDESFSGPFSGEAMLIFAEPASLELAQQLVPGDDDAASQAETLAEVGNIVLNGCLAAFANLMGAAIDSSLPRCHTGPVGHVVSMLGSKGEVAGHVLFVRIEFGLTRTATRGYALFLLDIGALDMFREAVRRFIAGG